MSPLVTAKTCRTKRKFKLVRRFRVFMAWFADGDRAQGIIQLPHTESRRPHFPAVRHVGDPSQFHAVLRARCRQAVLCLASRQLRPAAPRSGQHTRPMSPGRASAEATVAERCQIVIRFLLLVLVRCRLSVVSWGGRGKVGKRPYRGCGLDQGPGVPACGGPGGGVDSGRFWSDPF